VTTKLPSRLVKTPRVICLRIARATFLVSLFGIVTWTPVWARPKHDVLTMTNGDRITCEIIRLDRGYLFVKLDYGDGTVSLDWSKVARVSSSQLFVMTDDNGDRRTGVLQTNAVKAEEAERAAPTETGEALVNTSRVLQIERSDVGFWRNQHGSINFGLNLAKQDSRTQYTLTADDTYVREKWSLRGDFASSLATGGGTDLRNDLIVKGVRQFASPRDVLLGYSEFLQSDEQKLDLRTTIGGGLGHFFQYSEATRLLVTAGVVLDSERYYTGPQAGQTGNSLEGMVGAQMNFFRFKKTDVLATAQLYPSMTDAGRILLDVNASSRLRVARDLYWNVSYYLNFDSRPPSDTPQSDYGLSSGLGWIF
jgi:hypothetical protein